MAHFKKGQYPAECTPQPFCKFELAEIKEVMGSTYGEKCLPFHLPKNIRTYIYILWWPWNKNIFSKTSASTFRLPPSPLNLTPK